MHDENKTLSRFARYYPHGSANFRHLVSTQVQQALDEDIGTGDLTALLIDKTAHAEANIVSREHAVICGIDWVNSCFQILDGDVQIDWQINEGDKVQPKQKLCTIRGNVRALLTAERCALNFLQTLSAVSTQTQQYVQRIKGSKAKVLDTRKTLPNLRLAQKYAVAIGGGYNQRLALYDGILIKENHIVVAGGIAAVLKNAQALDCKVSIQIEVENLSELKQSLNAGATSVLLDDFSLSALKQAVELNQGQARLEASGNITLNNVRDIAETGVDYISIGALTKNIRAIDLSMRIK